MSNNSSGYCVSKSPDMRIMGREILRHAYHDKSCDLRMKAWILAGELQSCEMYIEDLIQEHGKAIKEQWHKLAFIESRLEEINKELDEQ